MPNLQNVFLEIVYPLYVIRERRLYPAGKADQGSIQRFWSSNYRLADGVVGRHVLSMQLSRRCKSSTALNRLVGAVKICMLYLQTIT